METVYPVKRVDINSQEELPAEGYSPLREANFKKMLAFRGDLWTLLNCYKVHVQGFQDPIRGNYDYYFVDDEADFPGRLSFHVSNFFRFADDGDDDSSDDEQDDEVNNENTGKGANS